MNSSICILAGNSNRPLTENICKILGCQLGSGDVKHFSDGETSVDIHESIRGKDIFIVQSTCSPTNEHLMELLVMLDATKRASAKRVTAVIPYFGYARQDRKASPRAPITAKLIANLLTVAGADRVLTMDLHAGQIQGFFDIPVDNLYAKPVMIQYIRDRFPEDLCIVAPDAGGVERARAYAKPFKADLAIIDKRRERANESNVMHIIGDVKGKICLIVDDIVDTAGTLTKGDGASIIDTEGRLMLHPWCAPARRQPPHGIRHRELSLPTPSRWARRQRPAAVTVLTVAPLLAEAIKRIHTSIGQ